MTERAPIEPGSVIDQKYRVLSLLGEGGVGIVYLARDIELGRDIAIKALRPAMAENREAVRRFAREAHGLQALRSARITRVFDAGMHDGQPYIVMEYMVGCDLLEFLTREVADATTLCGLIVQACEGLADAHAQGVVHRDVKPENLFVVQDAWGDLSLKVFDFGISKFALTGNYSDVDLSSMRTEVIMGTPSYLSPEQIRSTREVDHRTDIWSLGVVLYEILAGGQLPFRADNDLAALVVDVLEKPHRSLREVAPRVPEGLAAVVDRCLVKDRDLRYQTVAELAFDLLPFAPARARASAEHAARVLGIQLHRPEIGTVPAAALGPYLEGETAPPSIQPVTTSTLTDTFTGAGRQPAAVSRSKFLLPLIGAAMVLLAIANSAPSERHSAARVQAVGSAVVRLPPSPAAPAISAAWVPPVVELESLPLEHAAQPARPLSGKTRVDPKLVSAKKVSTAPPLALRGER